MCSQVHPKQVLRSNQLCKFLNSVPIETPGTGLDNRPAQCPALNVQNAHQGVLGVPPGALFSAMEK